MRKKKNLNLPAPRSRSLPFSVVRQRKTYVTRYGRDGQAKRATEAEVDLWDALLDTEAELELAVMAANKADWEENVVGQCRAMMQQIGEMLAKDARRKRLLLTEERRLEALLEGLRRIRAAAAELGIRTENATRHLEDPE